MSAAEPIADIYTEIAGTTCYINNERGTVVQLKRAAGGVITGAFVLLAERPTMLYATLGAQIGSRGQFSEVMSTREITRDEFDELTGLAQVRRGLGWSL